MFHQNKSITHPQRKFRLAKLGGGGEIVSKISLICIGCPDRGKGLLLISSRRDLFFLAPIHFFPIEETPTVLPPGERFSDRLKFNGTKIVEYLTFLVNFFTLMYLSYVYTPPRGRAMHGDLTKTFDPRVGILTVLSNPGWGKFDKLVFSSRVLCSLQINFLTFSAVF